MSGSASEVSQTGGSKVLKPGLHLAYVFDSSSEKQAAIFPLCESAVGAANSYLLYLTGKQGVKGIRLSLKDIGFDVAYYERARQMRIADAEEWFLTMGKQRSFKTSEDLKNQLLDVISEAAAAGRTFVTVISETDSLVRKGFYGSYKVFDAYLGRNLSGLNAAFVCAFDQRELQAAGATNAREELLQIHSALI